MLLCCIFNGGEGTKAFIRWPKLFRSLEPTSPSQNVLYFWTLRLHAWWTKNSDMKHCTLGNAHFSFLLLEQVGRNVPWFFFSPFFSFFSVVVDSFFHFIPFFKCLSLALLFLWLWKWCVLLLGDYYIFILIIIFLEFLG